MSRCFENLIAEQSIYIFSFKYVLDGFSSEKGWNKYCAYRPFPHLVVNSEDMKLWSWQVHRKFETVQTRTKAIQCVLNVVLKQQPSVKTLKCIILKMIQEFLFSVCIKYICAIDRELIIANCITVYSIQYTSNLCLILLHRSRCRCVCLSSPFPRIWGGTGKC